MRSGHQDCHPTPNASSTGASFTIEERGFEVIGDVNNAIAYDCTWLNAALPVEFLYLRPEVHNGNVQLDWATATELNNAGFEVQRSIDGRRFEVIELFPSRRPTRSTSACGYPKRVRCRSVSSTRAVPRCRTCSGKLARGRIR